MIFYEEDWNNYQIVPGIKLKEEQLEAIDFILHKFNCIVNLSTGLGKTCTSLVASYQIMKKTNDTVTFIICPKQANTAYKKELNRMQLKYSISVTGEREYRKGSRYFIFNYSNLDEMVSLLEKLTLGNKKYRVIGIFDEVHVLGNPKSGITQKMNALRRYFTCCIGMSATPLLNDFQGLWSVCNFIKPNSMGNWWEFRSNWLIIRRKNIRVKGGRTRQIDDILGYKDLDKLREKLSDFIITRTYQYPLRYFFRECTLTDEEKKIYDLAAKGVLDEDNEQEDYAPRLWNLQRVADGCDEKSRDLGTSSKQKLLLKVLKEILERGEGSLIYTEMEDTYTVLVDLLERYKGYLGYHKLWLITGKVDFKERVKCEKTLQAGDLVICTKAGNKSINLQAVNNVVFYDYSFACGDIIQMVGRVARVDSKYEFQNIIFLEAKDTIDSYKRLLMQSNMTVIQEVFGKSSTMPYYGDIDNDVVKKFRQYFKNKMLWCR